MPTLNRKATSPQSKIKKSERVQEKPIADPHLETNKLSRDFITCSVIPAQSKGKDQNYKNKLPEKDEPEEKERDEGVKAQWSIPGELRDLGFTLSETDVLVLEPVRSESEADGVLKLLPL